MIFNHAKMYFKLSHDPTYVIEPFKNTTEEKISKRNKARVRYRFLVAHPEILFLVLDKWNLSNCCQTVLPFLQSMSVVLEKFP